MTTTTTRNGLIKNTGTDINFPYNTNTNMDVIDAAIAKCNFGAATDPSTGDDSADGYAIGSLWYNNTGGRIFACQSATAGDAVWRQVWPALAADMNLVAYQLVSGMSAYQLVSGMSAYQTVAGMSDYQLVSDMTDYLLATTEIGIWRTMPGTPTRVSDTQFTITDTSNANLYDKAFTKGTILQWQKSGGGFQTAIVKDAAYSTNAVTINILGNTLAAGFTLMKYCLMRPVKEEFIVPGKLPAAATTDIGKTIYAFRDILIFSALVRYKTAATTTGGVWDINDDGTSIFTTKPAIAATATKGTETVCNCVLATAVTVVAADSAITLDYDSGHATTPGSDAYVELLYMPAAWRYLS